MSQMKPVHGLQSYYFKLHFNVCIVSDLCVTLITVIMWGVGNSNMAIVRSILMYPLYLMDHCNLIC